MIKKYHLWLGYYDSIERYEQYIGTDNATGTSPLAIDLNMPHQDKEMDTAGGLTCLQPDLNHHFPLPELLFDTPVLHTDIEKIGSLYAQFSPNPPNTYIFYFNDELSFTVGSRFGGYIYIGQLRADPDFVEDEFFSDSE